MEKSGLKLRNLKAHESQVGVTLIGSVCEKGHKRLFVFVVVVRVLLVRAAGVLDLLPAHHANCHFGYQREPDNMQNLKNKQQSIEDVVTQKGRKINH